VENGSDGVFLGDPGNDTSFVHSGLDNGVFYYYSAFSFDAEPNYSDAEQTGGTPGFDDTPPGEVRSFVATASESTVTLSWLNPGESDFAHTALRYSTSAYPATPLDGLAVDNGNGGIFPAAPASADTFAHAGLTNGITYYYTAFTADTLLNYSSGASVYALPEDETPPELTISVLRNPYLSNYLDIYVLASEALLLDSLEVTVADEEVGMETADADDYVYRGDYDLYSTGTVTIKARATDLALNPGSAERQFSSSLIFASSGGSATSVDGTFGLAVPPGAAARDAYVLVWERAPESGDALCAYEANAGAIDLEDYVRVEFSYGEDVPDPEYLSVSRGSGEGAVQLDSYVDTVSRRIIAYTRELGVFSLARNGDPASQPAAHEGVAILYNSPNPFVHTTEIAYQVSIATDITVEIIGIDGRVVKELHRGGITAGRHSIAWDGSDATGLRVASGIYFVRIVSPSGVAGRKIAVLR
jgi:hypothetical protein